MSKRTNEGFTITDSVHIGSREFVIGERDTPFGKTYVTWQCKNEEDFYWGHYFEDRQLAEKDLLCRAGLELEGRMQPKPPR